MKTILQLLRKLGSKDISDAARIIDQNQKLEAQIESLQESQADTLKKLSSANAEVQRLKSEHNILFQSFEDRFKKWSFETSTQKDLESKLTASEQRLSKAIQQAKRLQKPELKTLSANFNNLVEANHKFVRKYFATELPEGKNLTWESISAQLLDGGIAKIVLRKFVQPLCLLSGNLRMALAENIISVIYDQQIFQQYYSPKSTEIDDALNQLYQQDPRREAIFRIQLLSAYPPEEEKERIEGLVESGADKAARFLDPLLFTPSTRTAFRSELEELFLDAANIWRKVQRSDRRGTVRNEPDYNWGQYEEYNKPVPMHTDHMTNTLASPIMSLFPQVMIDEDEICPGYALFSNQGTAVTADHVMSKARNSISGGIPNGGSPRRARTFSNATDDPPLSPKSPSSGTLKHPPTKNRISAARAAPALMLISSELAARSAPVP
ncbi:hypothetical protein B7463_g2184, partial [Scytalidium lignicola]